MIFCIQELKKELITSLSLQYTLSEANTIANRIFEYITGQKSPFFYDLQLTENQIQEYYNIKTRLLGGEPLQYILNTAYFFNLTFYVNPHVLIPRPETEEMTEWLIKYIQNAPNTIQKILDIGTGSGCIAITLKKKLPHIHVHAWEISPDAIEVAEYNAEKNEVHIHFSQQDLFQSDIYTAFAQYDCIVSNPPYIPWIEKHKLDKNVVEYEPHLALFVPDTNPLLFYEAIAIRAKNTDKPIVTEVHQNYADAVAKLYIDTGLNNVCIHKDLSQNARWVTANIKY